MKNSLRFTKLLTFLSVAMLLFIGATASAQSTKGSNASSSYAPLTASLQNVKSSLLVNVTTSCSALNPIFSSAIKRYQLVLDEFTPSVTLRPEKANGMDTLLINGHMLDSFTVTLDNGRRQTVRISIRSASTKVSENYSIQVSRAKRSNADLSAISISTWATITPAFDPGTTQYSVTIPYTRSSLVINPQQSDSAARCIYTVDGRRTGSAISLERDQSKTVLVTVTAQNGTFKKNYILNVSRPYPSRQLLLPFINLMPSSFMSSEQLIADDGTRNPTPDPATLPPPDTYLLEIDVVNQYVTAYIKDADGNYTVPYRYMICSSGKRGTSTPIGTFKMAGRKKRFGYFVKFHVFAQYWTQINGGIYFHSILYARRDVKTLSKGSYNKLGTAVSHGCIRLLPPDAKWIYENCAPGTTVVVTNKKAHDPLLPALLLPPPLQ